MSYFNPHIEVLSPYAPGEQPASSTVVKLNTNEHPYPPSAAVLRALAAVGPEDLRRYPDPLGDAFREAASEVLDISPQMLICGNVMDDLLNLAVRAFAGGNRPVVSPTPSYTLYRVLASLQDAPMVEVDFPEDYGLPADQLARAGGAVTFLANPNSPSGTLVPVEQIADLAGRLSGVLVVDEAYVDFAEDNALRLVHRFDNVLVFRSMSKGYSLAGLRFGYGAGPRPLIEGLLKIKDSYSVDAVSVAAAATAIQDQHGTRQIWQKVLLERERLTEALKRLGFSVWPSQANFVLARWAAGSARPLYEALAQRGIFVRYFDARRLQDCLRITVGTVKQDDSLLAALREIVRRAPVTTG